ncbi:hypothetical protein JFK97_06825 [Chromobacterium phragmitis]|uniref:hypothetical protein n=1 Tax=Chromobacterium amazonense TaxID=1382803 RepID=UPI0021B7E673|nr:hypothetical protein [Chromobacterium amazonense]MBM2884101.1 hypothetical protein [Chromobacterium amazonense]
MANPKVIVHQAAEANTQTVARAKPQYTELTDSLGRVIKLRKLSPVQESRIFRAVGNDATNQVYMSGYVLPAAMVAYLDGEPIGLPESVAEIEMVLEDLGSEGLAAINSHFLEEFNKAKTSMRDAERSAEEVAAKN